MKAVCCHQYGDAAQLRLEEMPIPVPKPGEILIKVHYSTVNRTDTAILKGSIIMRPLTGWRKPNRTITGTDFSGIVERVGKEVSDFQPGDQVWGFHDLGLSTHAEYMTIAASGPVRKVPSGFDLAKAAASAEGAHYAYYVIDKVKLKSGQTAIVNGATGAIGSAVLQMLVDAGLEVTAVCREAHAELVQQMGAKKVIDYTREDFTEVKAQYDYVFDMVGKSSFSKSKKVLKKKGVYCSTELGAYSQNPFLALITPWMGGRKVIFPIPFEQQKSMAYTDKLIEKGAFEPLIDRYYSLEEASAAYAYTNSGQKVGNVLLLIAN